MHAALALLSRLTKVACAVQRTVRQSTSKSSNARTRTYVHHRLQRRFEGGAAALRCSRWTGTSDGSLQAHCTLLGRPYSRRQHHFYYRRFARCHVGVRREGSYGRIVGARRMSVPQHRDEKHSLISRFLQTTDRQNSLDTTTRISQTSLEPALQIHHFVEPNEVNSRPITLERQRDLSSGITPEQPISVNIQKRENYMVIRCNKEFLYRLSYPYSLSPKLVYMPIFSLRRWNSMLSLIPSTNRNGITRVRISYFGEVRPWFSFSRLFVD